MTPGNEECMFDESGCSNNPPPGGGGGDRGGAPYITQCNDKIDNDNDGFCDYRGCIINNTKLEPDAGCTNNYDELERDRSCYTSWVCDPWGECIQKTSLQERVCVDEHYCKKEVTKMETQECVLQIIPKPKCIFLWLPCWLWLLILCILIASAIYYYYKKKKEAKEKALSILLPKKPANQKTSLKTAEEKPAQQKTQIIQSKSNQLTQRQKSVIAQINSRKK